MEILAIDGVLPKNLTTVHREVNLFWYEPSRLLVAKDGQRELGAVRYALRHDGVLKHGVLADLTVDLGLPEPERGEIAQALITEAEKKLAETGVTKIDAIVLDGENRTQPFQQKGYWPFRKTVVIEWDLAKLKDIQIQATGTMRLEEVSQPDPKLLADFILHSYQPYFQWWQEEQLEKPWLRTDMPGEDPTAKTVQRGELYRQRLEQMIADGNSVTQRWWLAWKGEKLVGACDAKLSTDENFDFGALVHYGASGQGIGSALMGSALRWLKAQGQVSARVITTSGMDDYDPTVYLYVQALGGKIMGEYLDLVKKVG